MKAYGEPSDREGFKGRLESISYDRLGMTFTLENGMVHHIIVRLRGAQDAPAGPAVSVELK
ncbi:hypothetical protein EG829_19970 [bacterium]|nr:hypothetical protein [bacterium]